VTYNAVARLVAQHNHGLHARHRDRDQTGNTVPGGLLVQGRCALYRAVLTLNCLVLSMYAATAT
jgi:hypothetical protein